MKRITIISALLLLCSCTTLTPPPVTYEPDAPVKTPIIDADFRVAPDGWDDANLYLRC